MNKQEREKYLAAYKAQKERGVPFFPDILFKDAVVALLIFLALIALAYFVGAPLEERADPADTNYNPRPEWYFLFLFQLLKYFPGEIEFVGVVVIPAIAIGLLFLLPFLDRGTRRHFTGRRVVTSLVALSAIGVIALSYISITEIPVPAVAAQGDQTALLYTENCAPCHGSTVAVPAGANLHDLITQGKHEGMPSWQSDLTTDEIDALAGFVLSPGGSTLFTDNCGECHDVADLVAIDPLELKTALDQGPGYPAHTDADVPTWSEALDRPQRTALVNFLVAPDGQRLFTVNCSSCHGRAVGYAGDETGLRTLISQGGLHLEMPPWRAQLSAEELDALAAHVVDPQGDAAGGLLFAQYCAACHGDRVPAAEDLAQAREAIAGGGSHETMPVWGDILTAEQLDALVAFSFASASGAPVEIGRERYADLCASCHGDFGEGGHNPARPDDIIAPISTSEYLTTRDDHTLRAIISLGQPNFGMSPFGSANGGPLDDDDIDAIITFMRTWEANPPVELPPEITGGGTASVALSGPEVYDDLCAQCHAPEGMGDIGPSLADDAFQSANSDAQIVDTINLGHGATPMIGWGEILSTDQIEDLVGIIRSFAAGAMEDEAAARSPSFAVDVLPLFDAQCKMCHGSLGGWDGTSYASVMDSGDNAPTVIPGDADRSLLAQKVLGTHTQGTIMPPAGKMTDAQIQIIQDWINEGAQDN